MEGVRRSADVFDEEAGNILRDSRSPADDAAIVSLSAEAGGEDDGPSLESSVVGLKEGEISYRASLGVIRSSDERFDDMLHLLAPRSGQTL